MAPRHATDSDWLVIKEVPSEGLLPRSFDFDGDERDDFFVYRESEATGISGIQPNRQLYRNGV